MRNKKQIEQKIPQIGFLEHQLNAIQMNRVNAILINGHTSVLLIFCLFKLYR